MPSERPILQFGTYLLKLVSEISWSLKIKAVLVALIVLVGVCLAGWIRVRRMPQEFEAKLVVEQADDGIPGISKAYHAELINRGASPVRVTRCDFVDDGLEAKGGIGGEIMDWCWEKSIPQG